MMLRRFALFNYFVKRGHGMRVCESPVGKKLRTRGTGDCRKMFGQLNDRH